jgi:glycosyltransferase involved in cell wall biosynthesis
MTGRSVYLTYLPAAKAYRHRVRQSVALHRHFDRVVLLFRHGNDADLGPLPDGVVCEAIFASGEKFGRLPLQHRLWRRISLEHDRMTTGDTLVVEDWFRFLAPLFPLLRLRRRARSARLLLLFSPVTSSLLWFMGSPWRDIRRCADFSYFRAWQCPWEAWSLFWSDAVCVQSHGLADAYRRLVPARKLLVVSNAVEAAEPCAPRDSVRKAPPRLLYVGNLTYNKGLELILGLDRPDQADRASVTLVGRGYRREGRAIAARLAATPFTVLPWQSADALAALYRDHDILLLPTLHEGMPRAVTEFLALGKPVVATDVPGLSDVRSPLLLRFPRGDQRAFEAAIDRASTLRDPAPDILEANRAALAALSVDATADAKGRQLRALLERQP